MQTPLLKKTQSTPQSLISCPAIKKHNHIQVFFKELSKTHKIQINAENMTTKAVIATAIQLFNQTSKLSLISDPSQYELFAAKKNGARDDGLPALEGNHYIIKTLIKRFYLAPIFKLESLINPIETKDTFSSIKSQFNFTNNSIKQSINLKQESNKIYNFCQLFCLKK